MAKFRKKPVVIEAMRYWGDVETFREAEEFTGQSFDEGSAAKLILDGAFPINTLEGTMVASDGDWIIRGVKGECYPCKPDVFAQTYDAIESR